MKTSALSRSLTLRLPKSLDRRIAAEARRQRLSRSELARAIFEKTLNMRDLESLAVARRQSVLASRQGADKDSLQFC